MMTSEEKSAIIEKYENYPTGVISDAMDALGFHNKGVITGLHALSEKQKRTAGFAVTVQQVRRRTVFDGTNLAKHGKVIDDVLDKGDILVIDMGNIRDVSTGGDLLALRAKLKGAKGELVNGCLRDVEDIEAMEFPVWFAGPNPRKSAYDIETVGVNVPVTISGVQVNPEDLIVMDRTGIMCVPKEQIKAVMEKCDATLALEEHIVKHLYEGHTLTKSRKMAREDEK